MIFRLARRTSFAAPVGLGAALFALAAVLAFVGSLASPAGVARAQEGTDTTDEESGETESTTATVEICVEDPDSGEVTCSDETAPAGESQPMPEGGVTGQACERDSDETEYVCTEEIVITKLTTSTLKAGDSTVFTVIGRYLEWSDSTYKLKVKRESGNRDIGFDDDCEAVSASGTAPKPSIERRYAYSHKFTLYACDETGGTVTAELLEDGRAIKSTSQSVTVRLRNPPTRLSVGINSRDADRLDVTYSRSEPHHHYQFEIHRAASQGGEYSRTGARMNSSSSPVSFDGLAKGYWYKARGRNCGTSDRDFCGDWSAWSSAIHLKLAPPTPSSVSVSSSSDDRVVVGYTRSESPHYYRFEILRSTSRNGSYTSVKTANVIRSPVYFSSLTKGYWYKARGKNCRTSARAGCGDWSGFSAPVLLPVSVSVSANTSAVTEGGRIKFTVTANPVPQFDITVKVKVSEVGSFITGTKPTSATIRSGSESATFTVRTLDDSSDESNGSVTARLRNPEAGAGYKLGSPKRKTVRVRDNDSPPPPANRAPTIGGSSSVSINYPENGAGDVTTFAATDPDGDSIKWSLSGTDSGDFSISATGGALEFRNSPDFENPKDSDTNNEYQVTVTAADDEGGSDSAAVAVTVTDVLEPPTGLSLSVNSTDDDKMDVAYTASEPPHYYQFEVYRASSKSGDYSEQSGVEYTANGGGTPPASFDGLTQGYWYKAQGRSCETESRSVCGAWSGFSASVLLPVSVSVSANKSQVDEGDDIKFTVTASPKPQSSITVTISVSDTRNANYISGPPPTSVSLSNSAHYATFTIATNDDVHDKANGNVKVEVIAGNGYKVGSQSSTSVIVRDNEPGAPTIDKNVTLGDQRLTVSWTPSLDTGYKTLTGYIVNYRRTTTITIPPRPKPPWSGLRIGLTPSVIIAGLTNGVEYEARVKACNDSSRSRCGAWSAPAIGTPRTTPGRIDTITPTGAQNKLTVDWDAPADGGAAISKYQLIHKKSTDADWPAKSTLNVIPTPGMPLKTEVDIVGLDDTTSYNVKVRACNAAGCRGWPTAAYAVTGYTALAIPTDLDVIPMALRKAELTWSGDSAAGGYEVQIQKAGDAWARWYPKPTTTASLEIDLDNVAGANGLGDKPYSYELRIKATSGGTYPDSELSEVVAIIDNPILTGGGRATGKSAGGTPQAYLKWGAIANVRDYTVRYRELGDRPRRPGVGGGASRLPVDHSSVNWPNHEGWPSHVKWPYYGPVRKTGSFTQANKTITTGLVMGEIYAFQLNYLTTGGQKVFSARDAYVWASDKLPTRTSRVGTYSFFGYWNQGEYDYTVCRMTFPSSQRSDWVDLINHAFKQWEEAAPDLVTVRRKYGSCTTDGEPISNETPLSIVRAMYNESNEVYMVNAGDWGIRTVAMLNNRLFLCITDAAACVISRRYTDVAWLGPSIGALDDGSVDVLVNVSRSDSSYELDVPGDGIIVDRNDTRFNTCTPGKMPPDVDFMNYELMVHEAGHALGLSNFSYYAPIGSRVAHPSIPDAVMNYYHNEPDCSPHPFDVMALEALYQTVRP